MKRRTIQQSLKSRLQQGLILLVLLGVQAVSFAQLSGPNNPDVEPENPPAVPFDDNLHIILLTAGAVLIFFKVRKMVKKEITQ